MVAAADDQPAIGQYEFGEPCGVPHLDVVDHAFAGRELQRIGIEIAAVLLDMRRGPWNPRRRLRRNIGDRANGRLAPLELHIRLLRALRVFGHASSLPLRCTRAAAQPRASVSLSSSPFAISSLSRTIFPLDVATMP